MEKQYLNEKNYKKVKTGIIIVGLIIIIAGLLGGAFLIKKGFEKKQKIEQENSLEVRTEKIQKYDIEINDYKEQLKTIEKQIFDTSNQKKSVSSTSNEYFNLTQEEQQLEEQKYKVETAKYELEQKKEELENYDEQDKTGWNLQYYIMYFVFGGVAIIMTLSIGFSIITQAFGRNILAFQAQTVMPIAKEGIDEIAPIVSNAVGSIAKEITSGIKEGLKDEKRKK